MEPASQALPASWLGFVQELKRFLRELKRRNIVRVTILYLTLCWALLDPLHVVILMLPESLQPAVHKLFAPAVLILMALGLPIVWLLAWAFELTPSGVKPTVLVDPRVSIRAKTGRRMDRAIIVVLAIALAYFAADKYLLRSDEAQLARAPVAERSAAPPATASAPPAPAAAAPAPPGPGPAAAAPVATTIMAPPQAPLPAPALATAPERAPVVEATAPHAAPPAPESSGRGAQARAVVTILDGQLMFIRGLSRFAASEGVRLAGGDILATGPDTFAQLEFEGGTQVELGPQTQLMLPQREGGAAAPLAAYLQDGWIKVTAGAQSPDELGVVRSAWFELRTIDSVTVARVAADGADVFAEVGGALLIERTRGKSSAELALKPAQFYTRRSQRPGTVVARPSPGFLGQIPVGFRDTLPSRLALFRARAPAAQPASDFTYADVEPWLRSEPSIRHQLVQRWKDRASEAAFRSALQAHLRELPEWYPILYPPKDVPEERPAAPREQPGAAPPAS